MKKTTCRKMLCRIFAAAAVCLVSIVSVVAQDNEQKVYPVGSDLYRGLVLLYTEQGISPPSSAGPWSAGELLNMLDRIEPGQLSANGRSLYDELEHELGQELPIRFDPTFSMDLGFTPSFEIYYHTNSQDFTDEGDWVIGYTERNPLVLVSFELALHDWIYTYSEIGYKKNRFGHNAADGQVSSAFLYSPEFSTSFFDMKYVDFETPYRAFIAAGGDGWNLQFGRDTLNWGRGRTGNLVIGDHLDYHDFLSFKSYHDTFDYQMLTIFIDYPGWDIDGGTPSAGEVPSAGIEAFLGHRLEFRLLDRINLSLTENVMYKHTHIDPRYLNPAYIFHNLNNREMFNAIASVEIDAAVAPGVSLYGQYVLDQARAPLEDSSQPDCFGYLGGVNAVYPLGPGYLTGGVEYVLTSPYLYQRDLIDFIVTRRQFVIGYSFVTHKDYLGYQYGGDAKVADLVVGYELPGYWDASAGVRVIVHGDVGIDDQIAVYGAYPDPDDPTPHGDVPEITSVLSLEGSIYADRVLGISALADIKLECGVYYITRENQDNVEGEMLEDLQVTAGISINL